MLAKFLDKVSSDKDAAQPPLSAHRAFPAVVAAWFAVLFGAGSLVLPITLFEALATGTGISSIIDSTAPPLGTTARIGIAILAALMGAGIGLFLARKVAQASAADSQPVGEFDRDVSAASELPAKKPISARDELGSEFLDDPVNDEDVFAASQNAQTDTPDFESPLELGEFTEHDEDVFPNLAEEGPDFAPASFVAPTGATRPYQPEPAQSEAEQQVTETPIAPESDPQETDTMPHPEDTSGYNPFGARAAELSDAERPFAPPPGFENEDSAEETPLFGMPQPADMDEAEAVVPEFAAADEAVAEETPAPELPEIESEAQPEQAESALAGLSMAELVDRFSRSLKNRAAHPVEAAAPVPLALQPVSFEDDSPEDDFGDASLPDLALGEAELDDDALEKGYSSLLAMKSPIGQKRDSDTDLDKAVVTFPASGTRYAAPAADGPTRSPEDAVQPPVQMPAHPFGSPEASPKPAEPVVEVPQSETPHEIALSEALEKLQRLSRAG